MSVSKNSSVCRVMFKSVWRWYGSWAGYILHPDVDWGGRNSLYTRIKASPSSSSSVSSRCGLWVEPLQSALSSSIFSGTWVDLKSLRERFYHFLQRIGKQGLQRVQNIQCLFTIPWWSFHELIWGRVWGQNRLGIGFGPNCPPTSS